MNKSHTFYLSNVKNNLSPLIGALVVSKKRYVVDFYIQPGKEYRCKLFTRTKEDPEYVEVGYHYSFPKELIPNHLNKLYITAIDAKCVIDALLAIPVLTFPAEWTLFGIPDFWMSYTHKQNKKCSIQINRKTKQRYVHICHSESISLKVCPGNLPKIFELCL